LTTEPLTLVPFARADATAAMRSALSELGYTPQVLSPNRIEGGAMAGWSGAVVFLLGAGQGPRDRILSAMKCARAVPSLAMLVSGESGWDLDLIEHCCDCAQWPCTGDELAFRVGRLCRSRAPGAGWDDALCETLAEMNLVGRAPAFVHAMGRMRRMVPCDAPVLVEGETGTGKELVARAIHYLGPRAGGPFVPVNCAALPDHLVENELFGHERGAYTDAKAGAPGAIGEAAGGTLFLDEVEALSAKAQAALLRFLHDREYRPLGGQRARQSDARVIAASNANLRVLCDRREFRPDLYFRLDILSLSLPPLRTRREDIGLLAEHFLNRYGRQYGRKLLTLDRRCLAVLHDYPWPGNVRELENMVHRQVLMAEGTRIYLNPGAWDAELATPASRSAPTGSSFAQAKAMAIASFERDYLKRLMEETGGNVSQAALRANKERRALGKLLKKHRISPLP
jgi:DNA-binding NtrC family response regulator